MINEKKQLKMVIAIEKANYKLPKLWRLLSFLHVSEQSIIWNYQRFLRKYEYHLNSKHRFLKFLYKFKMSRIGIRYGILIPPNVFDVGLKIIHLGSIVVNSATRVGKNCLLGVGTAFVATNKKENAPQLGDNCSIGTGAIIVGDVRLGNDVAVGAGAVVVKSFSESNITIAGVPAKIISNNHII